MKAMSLILFSLLFAKPTPLSKTQLKFPNGKQIEVEVAQSFLERSTGLMHRTELAKDSGMLFVFDGPQKLSFWMKDTFIPLSIAYVDDKKVIKEIHHMKAQNMMEKEQHMETYPSECMCQFALEMNAGWFKTNKVKVGDQIHFTLPHP